MSFIVQNARMCDGVGCGTGNEQLPGVVRYVYGCGFGKECDIIKAFQIFGDRERHHALISDVDDH